MAKDIDTKIEHAKLWPFFASFFALAIYAGWAFRPGGLWERVVDIANGGPPETKIGFPAVEPARSINLLSGDQNIYLLWQVADIPYAILNMSLMSAGLALGLKTLNLSGTFGRILLALPVVYLIGEVVENSLLSAMITGRLDPNGTPALFQQLATTFKLSTGFISMPLALIGGLGAVLLALYARVKPKA